MRSTKLTYFAAGALLTLVVGSGTAVAATGGNFLIGKGNYASTVTGLTSSTGIALSLRSPADSPALKVGNTVKVPNLNADEIDGVDSSALALKNGGTGVRSGSGVVQDDGVIVATATCPTGTKLTGGGAEDYTTSGLIFVNTPDPADKDTWVVVVAIDDDVSTPDGGEDVIATAVCYNPRGAVAEQATVSAADQVSPQLRKVIRAKAAALR